MGRTLACDVDGELVSDDECRACALGRLKRTDPSGVQRHCSNPTPFIRFITRKDDSRKNAGVSATMLASSCFRQSIWQNTRDYVVFVRNLWAAAHGTLVHDALERHTEAGTIAEDRYHFVMPSGRTISGQIDRYLPDHARIEDYKTKDKPMRRPPDSYVAQLNIYRYMVENGATDRATGEIIRGPVNELSLYVATHLTWQEVPVPVWPLEFTEQYIETALDWFERMHDPTYIPPRGLDPTKDKLCLDYCAFKLTCRSVGGPDGHPMDLLKGVQR